MRIINQDVERYLANLLLNLAQLTVTKTVLIKTIYPLKNKANCLQKLSLKCHLPFAQDFFGYQLLPGLHNKIFH